MNIGTGDGLLWTLNMLGQQLSAALEEIDRLRAENEALQGAVAAVGSPPAPPA